MIRTILADTQAMVRQGLAALLDRHPDVELLATLDGSGDVIGQIRRWHPDVAILVPAPDDRCIFPAIVETAARTIGIRIVWIAPREDPRLAVEMERLGVYAVLTKNSTFEDLVSALVIAFHGGTYMPPLLREAVRALASEPRKLLSPREREVLRGIASGHTSKLIARRLGISPKTVETYRSRLTEKLELSGIAELVRYAVENGLD